MHKEQWIKVTEGLPELNMVTPYSTSVTSDYVLIFNGYSKRIGFIKQYYGTSQIHWFNDYCDIVDVTHWRYLPENPS